MMSFTLHLLNDILLKQDKSKIQQPRVYSFPLFSFYLRYNFFDECGLFVIFYKKFKNKSDQISWLFQFVLILLYQWIKDKLA